MAATTDTTDKNHFCVLVFEQNMLYKDAGVIS